MKTKLSYFLFFVGVVFSLQSFQDPYYKKRITDTNFKYEFYTIDKKVKSKSKVTYYWFKGGAIHYSQEGIGGELLNDQFDKFYLNNQLAERGKFKKGKKVGVWKTWHPNGILATETEWAGGQRNGNFISYNEKGALLEKGLYRVDKKQGKWINYTTKDTLKYKDDLVVVKKIKIAKEEKQTQKEKKKEAQKTTKDIQKGAKDLKEKTTKNKDSQVVNKQKTSEKKEGFFHRLFSKKDKKNPANAKGS